MGNNRIPFRTDVNVNTPRSGITQATILLFFVAMTCCFSCGTDEYCPEGTLKSGGVCKIVGGTDAKADWSLPTADVQVLSDASDDLTPPLDAAMDVSDMDAVSLEDTQDTTPQDTAEDMNDLESETDMEAPGDALPMDK